MVANLRDYLRAVSKHVYALTIGGIGFVLTLISLAAPAVVRVAGITLVITGVFAAQFLAWCEMRKERDAAVAAQEERARAIMQPRHYGHAQHPYVYHRVGIFNAGQEVADNVRLLLVDITPRPTSGLFKSDFPYPVPLKDQPLELDGVARINPLTEVQFGIAKTWSSDGRCIVGGIERTVGQGGVLRDASLAFEPDEKWEMRYRVSAANADTVEFIVKMEADGDELRTTLSL